MGFFRNLIALAFVATLLFYFVTVGEMEQNQQWIVIGVLVSLGLIFILSGSPSFELPAPLAEQSKQVVAEIESSEAEPSEEETETIPAQDEFKTMSLKERKAAKILAAQEAQRVAMASTVGDGDEAMIELPVVEVELSLIHI